MRIDYDELKKIIINIKKTILNKRIEDIVLVNSRLFILKIKNCNDSLVIDLSNSNPYIGLIKTDYDELSLPNEFIAKTMSKGKPLIKDISLVNKDKIVKIETSTFDAYYHNNKYNLYIELIHSHANMILTDENDVVIVAFYETSINSPRVIAKKFKYTLPEKKNLSIISNIEKEVFVYKKYQDYILNLFNQGLIKRKDELFGSYIKKSEKKIKSLNKKLEKIKESIESAKNKNNYVDIGNEILTHIGEIKKGDTEFNGIKLDPSKTPIENANFYFNKFKKSQRTLNSTNEIIDQINKELEIENYKYELFKLGNVDEISSFIKNDNKNKNKQNVIPSYLPYYIKFKDFYYYYGRNAIQNDYLTFKMFRKNSEVVWMHIKDIPSSHLIINKTNPTNEELDIACSILLLINKMKCGEIIYANRKSLTRDDQIGKVNISSYKSINMNKINPLVKSLLSKERRVHE